MTDKKSIIGTLWSLVSAFLWSTTFVGARFLMSRNYIDPITLSGIRFLTGGSLLFLIGTVIMKKKMFQVSIKDMLYMAMLAFFGMLGMSVLLFYGQQTTSATNSALLMQLSPIFTIIIGVFTGIKIKGRNIAGVLFSFFGCLIVIEAVGLKGLTYSFERSIGDLLLLGSAFSWSIYTLLAQPAVLKFGGLKSTAWIMLFGALELFLMHLLLPLEFVLVGKPVVWAIVLYIAAFPTAIAFFAWLEAMDKISLMLLTIMQYLTPFFTIVLAAVFLGEKFGLNHAAGFTLILTGIYISEFGVLRRFETRRTGRNLNI